MTKKDIDNLSFQIIGAAIEVHKVFDSQILTYMNLLNAPKGILINFYCKNIFKEGQKTFVNEIYRNLP